MTTQHLAAPPDVASLRRPAGRRAAWLLAGLAVLLLCAGASIAFGSRVVSLDELVGGLGGSVDGIGEAAVVARLPRTALAMVVGAALAVAGACLQGATRNPLADPGILGISSGAALAVVVGLAFFGLASPYAYMAAAILGAGGAAVFVYTIGSMGRGGATPLKLALAGAASTAAFGSLLSAILLPRVDVLTSFRFWQVGGVGGATWSTVGVVLPVLGVGLFLCLATAPGLNLLALGDDAAASLGANVRRTRLISALGAVILCGAATAVAGPIAFVGLVVPHLCRLLLGADYRWLLPFSAVVGATLLVGADVLGRIVARPEEIEVGIVTALIGAPFFIWIVRRQKVRDL